MTKHEEEVHTDAAGAEAEGDLVAYVEPEEVELAPVSDYEEVEVVLMTDEEVLEAEGDKSSPRSPGHLSDAEVRGDVKVED